MLYVVFPKHNFFGVVFILRLFPKPVFGIDAIPNTDLTRRYAVRCLSKHSQPNDFKVDFFSELCFQNTKR